MHIVPRSLAVLNGFKQGIDAPSFLIKKYVGSTLCKWEASIATLSARFEGMARTVGRHYPYFNSALTKKPGSPISYQVLC